MLVEIVEKELSYAIVGALFDIYNEIGFGHKEAVYQKAVAASLRHRGLEFVEQVHVPLEAFGERVGRYYLDFPVAQKVILELKALQHFRMIDYRQATRYLQSTKLPLAILATFTPSGVRYRRVLNIK